MFIHGLEELVPKCPYHPGSTDRCTQVLHVQLGGPGGHSRTDSPGDPGRTRSPWLNWRATYGHGGSSRGEKGKRVGWKWTLQLQEWVQHHEWEAAAGEAEEPRRTAQSPSTGGRPEFRGVKGSSYSSVPHIRTGWPLQEPLLDSGEEAGSKWAVSAADGYSSTRRSSFLGLFMTCSLSNIRIPQF